MYGYTRPVYYYETDKMGVVHHSNYLRWMEEARTFFFNDVNLPYHEMEESGIICPVTDAELKYKSPAHFGDTFTVNMQIIKYTGVRMRVSYTVVNQNGTRLLEAESGHAFINKDGKPVSINKIMPDKHNKMLELVE